jgi:hypothetical protein
MKNQIPLQYTANDLIEILTRNIVGSCNMAQVCYQKNADKFNRIMQELLFPARILANLIAAQNKDQKWQDQVLAQSHKELEEELQRRQIPRSDKYSNNNDRLV